MGQPEQLEDPRVVGFFLSHFMISKNRMCTEVISHHNYMLSVDENLLAVNDSRIFFQTQIKKQLYKLPRAKRES